MKNTVMLLLVLWNVYGYSMEVDKLEVLSAVDVAAVAMGGSIFVVSAAQTGLALATVGIGAQRASILIRPDINNPQTRFEIYDVTDPSQEVYIDNLTVNPKKGILWMSFNFLNRLYVDSGAVASCSVLDLIPSFEDPSLPLVQVYCGHRNRVPNAPANHEIIVPLNTPFPLRAYLPPQELVKRIATVGFWSFTTVESAIVAYKGIKKVKSTKTCCVQ